MLCFLLQTTNTWSIFVLLTQTACSYVCWQLAWWTHCIDQACQFSQLFTSCIKLWRIRSYVITVATPCLATVSIAWSRRHLSMFNTNCTCLTTFLYFYIWWTTQSADRHSAISRVANCDCKAIHMPALTLGGRHCLYTKNDVTSVRLWQREFDLACPKLSKLSLILNLQTKWRQTLCGKRMTRMF